MSERNKIYRIVLVSFQNQCCGHRNIGI